MRPFLCNFVNQTFDIHDEESTDLAQFMRQKGLLARNSSDERVLIIAQNYDIEADLIGIGLLRQGIDYIRLNIDDIPESVRVGCSISNDSEDSIFNIQGLSLDPSAISVTILRYSELTSLNFGSNALDYIFSMNQWHNILKTLENKLTCEWINSPYSNEFSEIKTEQLISCKKNRL